MTLIRRDQEELEVEVYGQWKEDGDEASVRLGWKPITPLSPAAWYVCLYLAHMTPRRCYHHQAMNLGSIHQRNGSAVRQLNRSACVFLASPPTGPYVHKHSIEHLHTPLRHLMVASLSSSSSKCFPHDRTLTYSVIPVFDSPSFTASMLLTVTAGSVLQFG